MSDFTFTFHFHALEKEMATHSSVLAWRIPGMGEPGWLPSMGSHRVGHNWSDLAAAAGHLSVLLCGYLTTPLPTHYLPLSFTEVNMFPLLFSVGFEKITTCFLGGSDSKEPASNVGDTGLTSRLWRAPGEGNDNPVGCLENPMDRGAWKTAMD